MTGAVPGVDLGMPGACSAVTTRKHGNGPAKPPRQPGNMGIHNDAWLAEGIAQHQVGRLAPDTRQGHELFLRVGNLAAEPIAHRLAEADKSPGLSAEEPGRPDQPLELGLVCGGVVAGRGISGEQRWSHLVDQPVRAPGRQDRRNQQFERRGEVQLDTRVWVQPGQFTIYPAGPAYQCGPRRRSLGHRPSVATDIRLASAVVSVVASMFNAPARMLRWTGYREPIRANYCHLPPPVPAELDDKTDDK